MKGRQQGMELWRPDWAKIYNDERTLPDHAGELVSVTRETLRLALSCMRTQNEDDYYHNYGAAQTEMQIVLGMANEDGTLKHD